ncbi:DUF72 domain-containing protein [Arthrobacter sp. zg-Y1171]|uniref:DUF72 domain-containing protein n=1 Tax=unclassified Arthrobacter TaxID=235627 RepID=UPI002103493F|nr:DUF72 domain-containing protein [Arthrobacter sp. zg-Y1171]MCQ1947677.1 DUF72 domain-containing protein [Arthrobacter sp. zg-Y1116]MCQ1987620.1 DUF72 domain-containing protein [Arthrobacter sp. zg-Y844]MCQ1996419.1 DUF72 domain-containing protein [Arthrobacter sp. zg-Y1171]UWX82542.1 DUF72 domain-containing protein [Arthrobacter sp. zg-Y1171]
MSIHIGTSGWAYTHWRNVLYPKGVPARVWLERYASEFDTVEFNGSFYRWPREEAFAAYRDRLPEGYVFSVKAPRGLTHGRKLRDPDEWVGRIERCFAALGDRSGVFLLQLSPDMERDDDRLDYLLAKLPDNIRVAVEFRHDSWNDDEVFQLLERHGAAYTVMSGAHLPCTLRATAPFVYVRLHGPNPEQLYVDSYTEEDLQWWAARIREWESAGKDVYAYFNNDLGGHAVRNAWRLRELTSM